MRTAKVERAALGDALRTVGVIAANERGLAEISVRFSGWVQQLMVSETGQRVRRGEVLANVYSPEVLRAEQEYLTARGWDSKAPAADSTAPEHHGDSSLGAGLQGGLAADARRRLELLGIGAQEIDAMASRGKVGDSVPIRSPSEGYVTARNVVPGAAIQPGAPLFEVADLSKVWLLADVFEQDAARLRIGQKAGLGAGRLSGRAIRRPRAVHLSDVERVDANAAGPDRVCEQDRAGRREAAARHVRERGAGAAVGVRARDPGRGAGRHRRAPVRLRREGRGAFRAAPGARRRARRRQGAGRRGPGRGRDRRDDRQLPARLGEPPARRDRRTGGIAGCRFRRRRRRGPDCGRDFDAARFPDKARACRACEHQHRGMGTMEQDCKAAIEKPWK